MRSEQSLRSEILHQLRVLTRQQGGSNRRLEDDFASDSTPIRLESITTVPPVRKSYDLDSTVREALLLLVQEVCASANGNGAGVYFT